MSETNEKSIKVTTAPNVVGSRQDNQFLEEKLVIRRHFLEKYPTPDGKLNVIDCCAGEKQAIWTQLRKEYDVNYLGMDKKKVGNGILKIPAERWLSQTEWKADVIDIDTYGEPWAIWEAALENFIGDEVTIFLTYCNVPVNNAVGLMSKVVRRRLGVPPDWKIWHSRVLGEHTKNAMLAYALECGFEVVEAQRIKFIKHKDTQGIRWDWNELYFYAGIRLRWLKKEQ
jgi:hypothetical protein